MSAGDLIAAARACLATPFHHQGRQPGVGLDCAGLLIVALRAVGIEALDLPAYGRRPHGGELETMLDAQPYLLRLPLNSMRDGDVLLMRFFRDPQHLALYAGGTILHAYEAAGQVVEHRMDSRWAQRIVRVYRIAAMAR